MSGARVYVGPWLEFHLPLPWPGGVIAEPADGSLVAFHPAGEAGVLRFVPGTSAGTAMNPAPARALFLAEGDDAALDHVNHAREKAWLFAVCSAHIQRMRQDSGLDPVVRWGVLRGAA